MLKNHFNIVWLRGVNALKADMENTYLGTVWWVMEPLLLTGLLYFAFASGFRGNQAGPEFLAFLLCGMLPFKWFASSISNSAESIVNNKGILGQFYLPKWIFACSINLSMLLRFVCVLPILFGALWLSGFAPSVAWLGLIPVIFSQLVINLGLSLLAAATIPLVPDLRHLVPLSVTGVLFTSGIFFDISSRPPEVQELLFLNPFAEIFASYRKVLLENQMPATWDLAYPLIVGTVSLISALVLMKALDRTYPRVLL
ncbi:ABC transporter permease [Microbulbifer sp. ZKSA002]|uniref:ABC transporter permease n=1 Tax=Microbulbifer sp. ZKSA002 TaxID=3243388 RepID=UPI00403981E7